MAKKTTTTKTTAAAAAKTPPPATKIIIAPAEDPPHRRQTQKCEESAAAKAALNGEGLSAPSAKTPAPRKKTAKPIVRAGFSNEDVALRAYYIAEKRQASGLPGDTHSDWVEAERQLRKEHGIKA